MFEILIKNIVSSLPNEKKVAVAVSGGADSVALLHILNYIKTKIITDLELIVIHIDHGLRFESGLDAEFVKKLSYSLNLPFVCYKLPPKPQKTGNYGGVEGWARKQRLEALAKIALENNAEYIALAHHKDDLVETIFLKMLRGTTIKGLIGIKKIQPMKFSFGTVKLWRPLLDISKDQLIQFLKSNNYSWVEDTSNQSLTFERNKIRHQLIPLIENIRKNSKNHIVNLSYFATCIYKFINKFVKKVATINENKLIVHKKIKNSSKILFMEAIRKWLIRLNNLYNLNITITRKIIFTLLDLIVKNQCGRKFQMKNFYIVKTSEGLECVFEDKKPNTINTNQNIKALCEDSTFESKINLTKNEVAQFSDGFYYLLCENESILKILHSLEGKSEFSIIDKIWIPQQTLEKFGCNITVRFRQRGDNFYPYAGVGHKKLAKWLIDKKIPAHKRSKLTLVCVGNEVLWIPELMCSNFVSKTEQDNSLLLLRLKKTS